MLRNILGVFIGIAAGVVVVGLIESIGHWIYPPPPGIDVTDPEALARLMHEIPLGAKLAVVIAWALGALAGGYMAALISRQAIWPPLIVGVIILAAGAYTLYAIPHPLWMAVVGILVPVPAALLGGRWGKF